MTAIWLSLSLTPVEKAFTVQGDFVSWSLLVLRLALVVFVFSQLRRMWRTQPNDSKTEVSHENDDRARFR